MHLSFRSLILLFVVGFVLSPKSQAEDLSSLYELRQLDSLEQIARVELDGDLYSPRGLVRTSNRIFLGCSQILELPTQRPEDPKAHKGIGQAHLFTFNSFGERLEEIRLGHKGKTFQVGGMSSDGERIWIPVSSQEGGGTTVYTVDHVGWKRRRQFHFPDRLLALLADPERRILFAFGANGWIYSLGLKGRVMKKVLNPGGITDVRDGTMLPDGNFILSGLKRVSGLTESGEMQSIGLGSLSIQNARGHQLAAAAFQHVLAPAA